MSKWRETNSPNEELDSSYDSDEDEAGFVLRVETIMGNGFHVFAYPSDTVELLKTRIAFQEGIPQADQNLILGKKTLDNPNAILNELGLNDDSTLRIITNIASGLPYKRDPPLSFQSTTNVSTDCHDLKLPRLNENQIDGVFVIRDRNDRRIFLIVKRSTTATEDENSDENEVECFDGGGMTIALGRRKQTKCEKKITKSGRDVHLERIRENAKTLKKMSDIRQTLCQKKKNENLELPKIRADSNRTINSSIASLNRLKAEIYLQSRREDYYPGSPPYTQEQLCKYAQLKVNILLSDDNCLPTSRFLRSSRSHPLTPTVVLNRKLWQKGKKSNVNHSMEFDIPSGTYVSRDRTGRPISAKFILSRPGTAASIKKKKGSVRCNECKKKIGLACRYKCRCGLLFCSTHRYAETHKCTFDYKEEGRRMIREANPLIVPSKVPEI